MTSSYFSIIKLINKKIIITSIWSQVTSKYLDVGGVEGSRWTDTDNLAETG